QYRDELVVVIRIRPIFGPRRRVLKEDGDGLFVIHRNPVARELMEKEAAVVVDERAPARFLRLAGKPVGKQLRVVIEGRRRGIGVCSIQVILNSPIDSVTTIRLPATIPGREFGSTTLKNRWRKVAPRLAAASSSVFRSIADITATTERTMKGSVKSTRPTRMKVQLVRNSRIWP